MLLRQPWSFNKTLFVFCDFDGDTPIEDYDFSWGIFWLQLHNVPFRYMNEKVGQILGSKAGHIEKVESQRNKASWNRWLRARVRVQFSNSLKMGCWLVAT